MKRIKKLRIPRRPYEVSTVNWVLGCFAGIIYIRVAYQFTLFLGLSAFLFYTLLISPLLERWLTRFGVCDYCKERAMFRAVVTPARMAGKKCVFLSCPQHIETTKRTIEAFDKEGAANS